MPVDSIAAVPPNGYVDTQAFSSKSLEWLTYLELSVPGIKHIGNSITGEASIANMRVDGYDESSKSVYEFYGCYYHACRTCFPRHNELHPLFKQTYCHVRQTTKQREMRLRILGYAVTTIWECEWEIKKEKEPIIQAFLETNKNRITPLDPFKAFFGGRVETFNLLIQNEGCSVKYEDVNSLYPFINATKSYPLGHPKMV